jgi:hypothetical protein
VEVVDVTALATALRGNTSLTSLDVRINEIKARNFQKSSCYEFV